MISIFFRSLAFNAGFYLSLLVHMALAIPSFFLPRQVLFNLAKSWSHSMTWMLRVFCNIHVEYRGLENIPKGPLLVAAKHQSAWETIALLPLFREPLFILKRELTWIPLFGLFLLKAQMIPINRGAGVRTMSKMTELARERIRDDRQLIIFPEGTRRSVSARAALQVRRGAGICRLRRAVPAGGAQFGPVLAAPHVHALSGHDHRRISRYHSARVVA